MSINNKLIQKEGNKTSSTNRSNAREEHIADYYVTPIQDIELFLNEFKKVTPNLNWTELQILDPCAGGDIDNPMSYPKAIKNIHTDYTTIDTIDIREDSLAKLNENYLTYELPIKQDIIITNPPFNLALEIIQKALNDVDSGGYVIMLLRLNFLETKSRKEFFDKYMPKYIFVHHKRMSFIKGKGTDSVAYAHYVWQKGNYPKFTQLKVI